MAGRIHQPPSYSSQSKSDPQPTVAANDEDRFDARRRARRRRRDEDARYLEIIRRRAEARRYRGVRPW